MPRTPGRDTFLTSQKRTKANESESEDSVRVRKELRALIADARYQRGDPDFRAYVRRQHERVFNDPTGKRGGLHVGAPKTFATSLELFAPQGHRAADDSSKRPTSIGLGKGLSPEQFRGGGLPGTQRPREAWPTRSGLSSTDGEETPGLRLVSDDSAEKDHTETLEAVDAMVARGRRMGFDLSADYLERYRDGVGGVDRWDWDRLLSYEAARDGDAEIKEHFQNWLTGELTDHTVGAPFLDLADGESIILGDDPNKKVWWTSDWGLPVFTAGISFVNPLPDSEETQRQLDFAYALGEAGIKSTAQLEFKRRGNFIYFSGYADFNFDETYDFEPGMLIDLASFFTKGAPTIGNEDLRHLAESGPAQTFRTVAHQRRLLTGVIVLTDGKPDPELSWFNWQDVAEEE